MGLEPEEHDIDLQDISMALDGHIKPGYQVSTDQLQWFDVGAQLRTCLLFILLVDFTKKEQTRQFEITHMDSALFISNRLRFCRVGLCTIVCHWWPNVSVTQKWILLKINVKQPDGSKIDFLVKVT